jgi:hypothetical protein
MKVLGTFLISECVRHFEFFHKFRKKEMSLELVNTSSILCGCQCANFDLLCFLILLLGLRVRVGFCCTVEEHIEKQFYLKAFLHYLGTHEMAHWLLALVALEMAQFCLLYCGGAN